MPLLSNYPDSVVDLSNDRYESFTSVMWLKATVLLDF